MILFAGSTKRTYSHKVNIFKADVKKNLTLIGEIMINTGEPKIFLDAQSIEVNRDDLNLIMDYSDYLRKAYERLENDYGITCK